MVFRSDSGLHTYSHTNKHSVMDATYIYLVHVYTYFYVKDTDTVQ